MIFFPVSLCPLQALAISSRYHHRSLALASEAERAHPGLVLSVVDHVAQRQHRILDLRFPLPVHIPAGARASRPQIADGPDPTP
eukprot:1002269-Rhodomonas_salina.1